MSPIQERLFCFLAEYNLSAQAFERKCNIGVATASKLTENSRETTFRKIQKAFPELNIRWLKTGEGTMLCQDVAAQSDSHYESHLPSSDKSLNFSGVSPQILILQERIKALEAQIAEKNVRIEELLMSLERERKMNDVLLNSSFRSNS